MKQEHMIIYEAGYYARAYPLLVSNIESIMKISNRQILTGTFNVMDNEHADVKPVIPLWIELFKSDGSFVNVTSEEDMMNITKMAEIFAKEFTGYKLTRYLVDESIEEI